MADKKIVWPVEEIEAKTYFVERNSVDKEGSAALTYQSDPRSCTYFTLYLQAIADNPRRGATDTKAVLFTVATDHLEIVGNDPHDKNCASMASNYGPPVTS